MKIISIPKERILELIKKDICSYYDYYINSSLEINVVYHKCTELKQFNSSAILELSFSDLATLLFDRVIIVSDCLSVKVSV